MDENRSIFKIRQLPNIVNLCQFLYILSGYTIWKAEYDRIFKIIPSFARF